MNSSLERALPAVWFQSNRTTYGLSPTAGHVRREILAIGRHLQEPITNREPSLEERFRELAEIWREETGHMSSAVSASMHPTYQRIIGMGPAAVPLLLRDMAETKSHWFWALSAITGENPVRKEDRGRVNKMVAAWLGWGQRRGML
jgi:hypothetical protein